MSNSTTNLPINLLLRERNEAELAKTLHSLIGFEIADIIAGKEPADQTYIFNLLTPKLAADTYQYLPSTIQNLLLRTGAKKVIADMLVVMSPDDRTLLFSKLPRELVNSYIQLLPLKERTVSLMLLSYPTDSTGHLMTTNYIAVNPNWTVEQVIAYIREPGKQNANINEVYLVDEHNVLLDDITIKELFFADKSATLKQISNRKFTSLSVLDSLEKAAQIFKRLGRTELPVIDVEKHLLGVVTIDDILRFSSRKNTASIQKIGAVEALDEPYMSTSFSNLMKKRVRWLLVLFIGEMFTATAMGYFENEISKAVVLALFLPLIISSGGNAGSQSSTLIIRAMALREVKLKDWWQIFKREILFGLCLGAALGIVGFFRVAIWGGTSHMYGEHWLLIATTIFLSLIGVVMWGSLIGSMLPLLLRRCHIDPATSSNPLVATLVDVTGIMIYFFVAMWVLKGTLL